MDLHRGCSEDCTDKICNKCLSFFQPSDPDDTNCNIQKSFPRPTFELVGFGGFVKQAKVTFKLYLRLKKGMMFNAKIRFYLVVIDSERRFLQKIKGTGIQYDIAQGTYSENSIRSNYLAKFDCKSDEDVPSYNLQVNDLELIEVNGDSTLEDIPLAYESLAEKDISGCTDFEIETEYSGNNIVYNFVQKTKQTNPLTYDFNRQRILSSVSSKCALSGNEGRLNIEGNIDRNVIIANEAFTLTTSDEKTADCTLTKSDANNPEAYLNCKIENPGRSFYLSDQQTKGSNNENYLSFANTTSTPFCQIYYNEDNKESSSSSDGLSGGAIVGIVIVCVVVVAVIGFILYYLLIIKNGMSALSATSSSSAEKVKSSSYKAGISTSNEIGYLK